MLIFIAKLMLLSGLFGIFTCIFVVLISIILDQFDVSNTDAEIPVKIICTILVGGIVLAQGLIVARAVSLSIITKHGLLLIFWYLLGLFFSIPLISYAGENKTSNYICILIAICGYIVAIIFPNIVPHFLTWIAAKIAV